MSGWLHIELLRVRSSQGPPVWVPWYLVPGTVPLGATLMNEMGGCGVLPECRRASIARRFSVSERYACAWWHFIFFLCDEIFFVFFLFFF
jgi:hypothetical protein